LIRYYFQPFELVTSVNFLDLEVEFLERRKWRFKQFELADGSYEREFLGEFRDNRPKNRDRWQAIHISAGKPQARRSGMMTFRDRSMIDFVDKELIE
ncbi:MAG: hypothetical protein KKD77_20685, partial [Gammaproteobacteria bacterium]|nr:hypothetical protein [Gammaproteobacteria bacterium]